MSPLASAFDNDTRVQLDQEIARMFYTGGLSFNLARNRYYMKAFTFAANHNLGGYVPPSYNKLRATLIQQEKANVERLLQPIKDTWKERGVSIVTDGWSDPQRRPLINFMATSPKGPMFIRAVNCMGEVKTKEFIAELMKDVIDEIGHQNVVQIITDNAANCKGAGELIEGIYPQIYWTPCVVHTLNLALKNICAARNTENNSEVYVACHWITEIHGEVVQIKFFIMNHTMRLSMYNKFTPLKLLSMADTRFASIIVMLKRFKLIKRALESLVMSDEWTSYKEDDQEKARYVRDKVLNELWWDKVNYILNFTTLVYDMIQACDTDRPSLHLVYEMWDSMIEKVKFAIYKNENKSLDGYSLFYELVLEILVAGWTKSSTPLHCLAHSLNPRYYSDAWLSENQLRVAPHRDAEISQERMKCFLRLYPNDDDTINCIVTGSTSGIGLEVARQLADAGAHVVMAVRNTNLANRLELDLSSLDSVARFANEWNSRNKPLNILINNAGIYSMAKPRLFSADGYEMHMQVNFLAPSLLSLLLLPSLKAGAPSRIVNVNSLMHAIGFVDLRDMNFDKNITKFTSLRDYARSKLAQIMFNSILLESIPKNEKINVICVNPGSVRTNVVRDLPIQIAYQILLQFAYTAREGSRSVLYAALYDEIREYCEKLKAEEWHVCAYVACDCKTMIPSKEAQNLQIFVGCVDEEGT